MPINAPGKGEIQDSVTQLFDRVLIGYPEKLLSALIAVDKTMHTGLSVINYIVDSEMQEICDFVNEFNAYLKQTDNKFQQIRVKILIYCHILEADLPLTVIWNLLRILNDEPCDWTFHRITKEGKTEVCEFTNQKIKEIARLSLITHTSTGNVLIRLWEPGLRNAFSHSQYCWMGDMLRGTNDLSPISRQQRRSGTTDRKYTFTDVHTLYQCAQNLLHSFITCYHLVIEKYKDGNTYKVQDGWVVWDGSAGGWLWEQNARAMIPVPWVGV